jgi:hypothetical protein
MRSACATLLCLASLVQPLLSGPPGPVAAAGPVVSTCGGLAFGDGCGGGSGGGTALHVPLVSRRVVVHDAVATASRRLFPTGGGVRGAVARRAAVTGATLALENFQNAQYIGRVEVGGVRARVCGRGVGRGGLVCGRWFTKRPLQCFVRVRVLPSRVLSRSGLHVHFVCNMYTACVHASFCAQWSRSKLGDSCHTPGVVACSLKSRPQTTWRASTPPPRPPSRFPGGDTAAGSGGHFRYG